jgi:hypothetical protein
LVDRVAPESYVPVQIEGEYSDRIVYCHIRSYRAIESMKPTISEFSYGYALTDELVHWHGLPITAAPVFPSLYEEGKKGGGYDVKLEKSGIPLFLQFKLSHCMVRNTAMEVQRGAITSTPFYRMHIWSKKRSAQHEMLLDLESGGNEVYYSAPAFHEPYELNDAYINHVVKERSLWIKPSTVGSFTDEIEHHVSFRLPSLVYICSEPRRIEGSGSFENFSLNILSRIEERSKSALSIDALQETVNLMRELSERRSEFSTKDRQVAREALQNKHPIQQMAFYAQVYFDAQLFIVSKVQKVDSDR